jgi:hypothetical protein
MAKYSPPDINYEGSKVFPPALWTYGGWHLEATLKDTFDGNYPSFVNEKAQKAIDRDQQIDGYSGAWFNFVITKASAAPETPGIYESVLAMCVAKGWPDVLQDIVGQGASLETIELPSIISNKKVKKQSINVLNQSVLALSPSQNNSPWAHEHHKQAFLKLLDMGADPNLLEDNSKEYVLFYLPMLSPLLDHGLDVWKPLNNGRQLLDRLADTGYPNPTYLTRKKSITELAKKGVPLRSPYQDIDLIDILSQTSMGVQLLPEIMKLYAHPDVHPGLKKNYQKISTKISRMPKDKAEAMMLWLKEVDVLLERADIESHTAPVRSQRSSLSRL